MHDTLTLMHQAITLYNQVLCSFERSYESKAALKKMGQRVSIATYVGLNCDQSSSQLRHQTGTIYVVSMALMSKAMGLSSEFQLKIGQVYVKIGKIIV